MSAQASNAGVSDETEDACPNVGCPGEHLMCRGGRACAASSTAKPSCILYAIRLAGTMWHSGDTNSYLSSKITLNNAPTFAPKAVSGKKVYSGDCSDCTHGQGCPAKSMGVCVAHKRPKLQ